jgi:ABC-2 type transport system permease protein
MNFELRNGTLAMRLLRPIHPLLAYAAENLAAMPMRFAVSLPAAAIALLMVGRAAITRDPFLWAIWIASVAGAWVLTLLVNFIVGSAAFFVESSLKLMDCWLVLYFVFSGYLVPIDLFPARLRAVVDWLPFRFQIGLPVEIMTGAHSRTEAVWLLTREGAWVAIALLVTVGMWERGIKRFAAYGG